MGRARSGKLELTWTNRHLRLLSDDEWRYLLVGKADISDAHGSWSALKKLGRS